MNRTDVIVRRRWPSVRIALANIPYPENREDSVDRVVAAIGDASAGRRDGPVFPRMLRSRIPDGVAQRRAAGCGVSRARVGDDWRGGRPLTASPSILGTERVTDRGVLITALVINADGTHRGVPGQGSDRSVGGRPLRDRRRPPGIPGRPDDVRHRDLPRRLALSGDGALGRRSAARRSCSIRTSTKPSPAAIDRRPLRIRRTHFTRRPRSAAPPRTPVSSRR